MKKYFLVLNLVSTLLCCGQNKQQFNFATDKSIERYAPDTLGLISFRGYYPANKLGKTFGYMIHKNGGNWWWNNAKKRFPKDTVYWGQYLSHRTVAKRLLKEDKDSLKNYNKWVFFTDKKYLESVTEYHGETGKPMINSYTKESIPIEIIIYQQLAGENEWKEIERRKFRNDDEYRNSSWQIDFYKKKLAESNLPKK